MSLTGKKTFRYALVISCVSILTAGFFAACGGGGGGGGTGSGGGVLSDTSTKVILSGTVDSQATGLSGGSTHPLSGATVNIVDSNGKLVTTTTTNGQGQYSALVTKLTDYGVSANVPSSKPARRAAGSGPLTLLGIVYVGGSDSTLDVNPGSTAAVIVLMVKLGLPLDPTGLGSVAGYTGIDLNATIAALYCLPGFSTLAALVEADIANKVDPFTDLAVIHDAGIVAAELNLLIVGSGGATSTNGTTVCVPPTNTTTGTSTGTGTGTGNSQYVPPLPAPQGVRGFTDCTPQFVDVFWTAEGGASGYYIYYDLMPAVSQLTSTSIFVAGGASNSQVVGPLSPATYYFAVSATNSVGRNGALSGVFSATTTTGFGC